MLRSFCGNLLHGTSADEPEKRMEKKLDEDVVAPAQDDQDYQEPSMGSATLDSAVDWYVDAAVHRPCCVFGSCCVIIFFMILISFAVGINTAAMGNNDWLIDDSEAVIHKDMIDDAYDRLDDAGNTTERSEVAFTQFFYYRQRSGKNLFTSKNLQKMCELEATLVNHHQWTKYCYVDPSVSENNCSQTQDFSIVQYFYGDSVFLPNGRMDCYLLNETLVENIADSLVAEASTESGQLNYGFYLAKSTEKRGYCDRSRSGLAFGGPLDGYSNLAVIGDKQSFDYQDYLLKWAKELWDHYNMRDAFLHSAFMDEMKDGDVEMLVYSLQLWDAEGYRIFESDFIMVAFSFAFVFCWMLNHIRSVWLAGVGMIQIILSLPASLFFYRCIGQITYFSTLQQLVIFVVLGVGADDVFVLVDAWRQSYLDVPHSVAEDEEGWTIARLKYAYIRTAQAVLNTSFTTAMAFCATAVSPIMPISTFGVYGAICIVMNYLFVITLTPAAIMINESNDYWPSCCRKKKVEATPAKLQELRAEKKDSWDRRAIAVYKDLILRKPVAALIVILLMAYSILSCVWASMLEAPTEQEQWLPDDHMFTRATEWDDHYLSNDADSYAQLDIIWGMKGLDRSDYDRYYPNKDRGTTKFDKKFDLYDSQAQAAINQACETLPTWSCGKDGCEYDLLVRPNTTICFLSDFNDWVLSEQGVDTSEMIKYESNRSQYMRWLKQFRDTQNPFDDPTETYEELIGFIDNELKFVAIRASMTMERLEPFKIKDPIEKRAESFINSLPKPSTAKNVFQYTWDWSWSPSQKGTIDGMTQGMTIAFPIAFATLLIATHNFVLSLFAIISVGSIVASTLGMCQAYLGWDLGTGEAIAGVMVIGLAVDYTIHLGHMYDHAAALGISDRSGRFEYAVDKMALTVLAGAITTAGAGLFMFACQSTFFPKMATLISGTVMFSIVYSLLFFMPLLSLLGPQGSFGKLPVHKLKSLGSGDWRARTEKESKEDETGL